MKIGIIGSGGREHALCHTLLNSKHVNKIYCLPGNAGTSKIAENVCRQQRHTHLCTQTTTTTLPLVKRIKLKRFNCYCVHSV